MSPLLETNQDVFFLDEQGGIGINEVSEYMPGRGSLIAIAQFGAEEAVLA